MIERYTRPEMGALWTQENKFRAWMEVELAVCRAWHKAGVIPKEAMAEIESKTVFPIDESFSARVLEIEERTRHDVIAFLTAVEERVGPVSRYIHLGCTSSDIVDTANSLLLARAGSLVGNALDVLLDVLRKLALEHKGRLCMGRTHGVHAEPTSFGLKMLGFYAEFARHRTRLQQAMDDVRVGKLSGAVGTYTALTPDVEETALELLGLRVDPVSTQIVQRDRYANFFTTLALMAGGVERLCVELRHLQRTEVREAEEGFAKGQKGSSAMPHKKNPISAENMSGLARLLRGNALAAMENQALWHERDISHSSVERVIMPDSTILAHYLLSRLAGLLRNLRIIPENMERNLKSSQQLFFSQRVLTALVESGLQRQEAYEMVQRIAMLCWEERRDFPEAVRADSAIVGRLGADRLDEVFDMGFYLRHEDVVYTRVLE
ncbi:adenylosuccinate lyase [Desulfocurvibacter africanus]|uniref:adenylosuccinate lyase n=1 Tax=Desulfocurvibacter africanus TaxID=873 RepID=UPI00041AA1E8|nr:adenylosuccinate lyase [Desulfocurvibacter africanus]